MAKMGIWGDFQGLNEATGGGRGVKNRKNLGDVVYGWSLMKISYHYQVLFGYFLGLTVATGEGRRVKNCEN